MSSRIDILIQAVDKASGALKSVGSSVGGLKSKLSGLTEVGKIAVGMLVRDLAQGAATAFGEAVELGGQIDTLRRSFESMRRSLGATDLSLEGLREATRGTVSDVDLLTAANQAMALGLPTDNLEEMFGAAMKLGAAMGIDATKAVESLSTGIGRQSKLILDNLGITFKAEDAYAAYAAQLGVSTNQLTENQKKLAWQEFAMKMVKERADALGDTISEGQLKNMQWSASMENLKTNIGGMLGPLGMIAPAIQGFLPMIGTLIGTSLPGLIGGLGGVKGAFSAMSAVMMANPIMLVVAAIAALVAGLIWAYHNVKPFRDAVDGLANFLGTVFKPVIDAVVAGFNWLVEALRGFAGFIQDPIGTITNAVTGLRDSMVSRFKEVYDETGNVWKATWEGLKTIPVVGQILGAVEGLANSILGVFGLNMDDVFNVWQTMWTSIQNFVSDPIGSIQNAVQGLVDGMSSRFTEVYNETGDKWHATWEALKTIPVVGQIIGAVQGVANQISNTFGGAIQALGNIWNNIWNSMRSTAQWIINSIMGYISSIINKVWSFYYAIRDAINWAISVLRSLADTIRSVFGGALDAIGNFIASICFAHAIHRAVDSSIKDLDTWRDYLDESMKEGLQTIKGFGEAELGGVDLGGVKAGAAAAGGVQVVISAPLVNVEGAADERTAEYAAELVEEKLKTVVFEATSTAAPTKRIRYAGLRS